MSDGLLFRAAPFRAVRGREGNRLVWLPLTGERRVISEGAFGLLDHLREFRTLTEHAETALQRMGSGQGRAADIRKALDDLKRQGFLISAEDFFRAAIPKDAVRGAPISTIGIPTSGGSKPVERCRESYAAHARKYGRSVSVVVAGGDARTLNEDLAAALGRAGIDPSLARFALLGEAAGLPSGIARTTGANRNALLLACAGEAFLSVDDDTLCSFVRSPGHSDGLALNSASHPLEMWFGPVLPPCEPAELDVLAVLGRALGPAIQSASALSSAGFEHAALEKLCRGDAKARVVQMGLWGDAATDSPAGWLGAGGATRERLVGTEAGYRAAMASRRVLAVAPCETVSSSRRLMAYGIALDHRELLPPFPPLGRDQDGVFGAWLRLVEPASFTVHVPFAVAHEPEEARSFPPPGEWLPAGMYLNEMLHLVCEDAYLGSGNRAPADRMRALGSMLEEAAAAPRADFEALLLERRLRHLSRRISFFESTLKAFGSRPAWWVQDVRRLARATEEEIAGADLLRFTERGPGATDDPVGSWQLYAQWCGRLLREWPAMREAALAQPRTHASFRRS